MKSYTANVIQNPSSFGHIPILYLLTKKISHFSTKTRFFCDDRKEFTHTDEQGKLSMVDISSKYKTVRIAQAEAVVHLGKTAFDLLLENKIQKGDVLSVSKIAGIIAAKKTSDLIPLCHTIQTDFIDISFTLNQEKHEVLIKSEVKTLDRTGVEMEAMTSVTIAALTIYDMCKGVSKDITINSVKLLFKTGGKESYSRK